MCVDIDACTLEAELIDLKKNLQQVESDQSSIRADQQVQNRAIQALDEKIARIVKRLRQAEKAALAAQTQTEMLQQHKASLEIQRDQKKALIKEHVLAASRLGKNGMLRAEGMRLRLPRAHAGGGIRCQKAEI